MSNTSSVTIINETSESNPTLPFHLDNSYKGDAISERCREILELDDLDGWYVADSTEGLALVHYKPDADMKKYGHIRGLLLDLEVGCVVADSFGYTPIVTTSSIKIEDDSFTCVDANGNTHSFLESEMIIKRAFEGVVIRAVWWKGNFYTITHKKINPHKSRWGTSTTFLEMYKEAAGPTETQLFDVTKPFSDTSYDFLVVEKSLLVATRQIVKSPYLVHLASRNINTKRDEADVGAGIFDSDPSVEVGGVVEAPVIYNPPNLSVEDANKFLKFGYGPSVSDLPDDRLAPGESVIVYKVRDGKVLDVIKVHSISYEWRTQIRGDNPNITNRFYQLSEKAHEPVSSSDSLKRFKDSFMLFPLHDKEYLKSRGAGTSKFFICPADLPNRDLGDKYSRVYIIWINYVLSLPVHHQEAALDILEKYRDDCSDLICWLKDLENTCENLDDTLLSKRAKQIIQLSKDANSHYDKVAPVKTGRPRFTRRDTRKSSIPNLISKERGRSLYSLIREMKTAKRLETET